ncbi:MAG: chromate efflux transporter, partial [Thermodesulfobacteriota bacterium]|nr:chromate efflux transporter [Thermodesulfobacteriota bacterium]
MLSLSLLFKRFLKIGATAYGGPAIAGEIKKAIVKESRWISEQEFLQGMALCQMLPGATWVMLSTYIGYKLRGIWGAFTCAVAFVLPAFTLILILSLLYFRWGDLWLIQSLFKGLGAVVVALILNALITFSRSILQGWKITLVSILSFVAFILRWNIVVVFLLAAGMALLLRVKKKSNGPAPVAEAPGAIRKEGDYLFLGGLALLISALFFVSYHFHDPLFRLCLTLTKIGALAFGGGFTVVALIQYDVVEKFHWVSTKEFLDGIAMGQVTPGPVMITATFLGYKLAGFWGAFMATIAAFSPPFFIITLLIPYYDRLKRMKVIQTMEQGILGSFIGMLGLVLVNFGKTTFVDIPSVLFSLVAFLALLKKIDLLYILLPGAILSILIF